jgi:hypothetical protein
VISLLSLSPMTVRGRQLHRVAFGVCSYYKTKPHSAAVPNTHLFGKHAHRSAQEAIKNAKEQKRRDNTRVSI